jgi:hypothetical protein
MTEFDHLRIMVSRQSTCDKRSVAAGCYVGERFITSANHCEHTGQICPRLSLPSGCQSELCASTHAEIGLLNKLKAMKLDIIPAIVWIYEMIELFEQALSGVGYHWHGNIELIADHDITFSSPTQDPDPS